MRYLRKDSMRGQSGVDGMRGYMVWSSGGWRGPQQPTDREGCSALCGARGHHAS